MKLKWKLNKLKKYYQDLFEKNKTDLSNIWEAICSIVKVGRNSNHNPCSLKHNGVLLFNSRKIAETFNFIFTNIGSNSAKRISKRKMSPMTFLNDKILKPFFVYPTTPDEIIITIKYFSSKKSTSPKCLPTPTLNNFADVLSFPFSYLVNLSFTTGEFPNLCIIAKVIPLFRKGDPLDCSNYRPISLLSTFSKIFEKCFCKCVYSFLGKNNLIFKPQLGFRSGYSSNQTIVNLVESSKKYIDNHKYVCSVFIDLEKAFNTMDH